MPRTPASWPICGVDSTHGRSVLSTPPDRVQSADRMDFPNSADSGQIVGRKWADPANPRFLFVSLFVSNCPNLWKLRYFGGVLSRERTGVESVLTGYYGDSRGFTGRLGAWRSGMTT
jgi:hypothetical protein